MNDSERRLAEGALFTDQYQLSMAQLYWRQGLHDTPVRFDHFFRAYPDYGAHQAGYCVNAGMAWLLDWMERARFGDAEIDALRSQRSAAGEAVFDEAFLAWLREEARFDRLTLTAVPEGRVVHPNTPLTVVEGPLAVAQLLETSLLAHLNYPILVATKAARIREAARGGTLLEFGLRRAHERGASAGARAALIGGADATSNVGVSHVLGLQPSGTHAHSMVQAFLGLGGSELDAFRAYAQTYPDGCLLLLDTVDTLHSGLPNAIRVFEELRAAGHEPLGVRLDSGDLAYLAIRVARELDRAGFPAARIVLSSSLDELVIWQILTQIRLDAPAYGVDPAALERRLVYGVGTRLIVSEGEAALGGVYKLAAVRVDRGWRPTLKLSDAPEKIPTPGPNRLWRVYDRRGRATADLLAGEDEAFVAGAPLELLHPAAAGEARRLGAGETTELEPLHAPVWEEGARRDERDLEALRARREADLARLDPGVKRIVNPHVYHVSLSRDLWERKMALVAALREGRPG